MLSRTSAAVVSATAPVVAENALAITRCFYPRMFAAHPELLRVFNTSHQASGDQPAALAASVVGYALHLLDPEASDLTPMLERVVHKHVALGIRPDQYVIVGRYLIEAVGQVLGEAVTPEVVAAWQEVYWLFALELTAAEARLYGRLGVDPDQPWRPWQVVQRWEETPDADVATFSLLLRPADAGPVPAFAAGQYVSVAVDLPDGGRQARQYSLSSARQDLLQLTVRHVPAGEGAPEGVVSGWLRAHAVPGATLQLGPVVGDVLLPEGEGPMALLSAGAGITPLVAMLEQLADTRPEQPLLVAHADRSPQAHALAQAQRDAVAKCPGAQLRLFYAEGADGDELARAGELDLTGWHAWPGTSAVLCGPAGFVRHARSELVAAGVAPERISYELFGPDVWGAVLPA